MTEVKNNGIIIKKYHYDLVGRLIREDNRDFEKTFEFVYDKAGNILKRNEYAYTEGVLPVVPVATFDYTYDTTHKNRLLSYNGETCDNYVIGNPGMYRGKAATWTKVHRLASLDSVSFAYNYAGIRTKKTVNGVTTKYGINGSTIVSEQKGTDTTTMLNFYYGFDGVTAFKYANTVYYYQKNIFGDIFAIYDGLGNLVAKYVYDAWGNHKVLNPDGTENTNSTFIGNINPFRYRSYYFDIETGLYYLQSRYYDPQVGRFISMDAVEYLAPNVVNGLNLYAYCLNNPVMGYDPNGTILWEIGVLILMFGGLAVGLTADSPIKYPESTITGEDVNINNNNPGAGIDVNITPGNIHIENSYKITNPNDQERIIEIIMGSELYQEYGFYRTKESYLSEWRAHNWASSNPLGLTTLLMGENGVEKAKHVDLNKDPEDGFRGFFYGFFSGN